MKRLQWIALFFSMALGATIPTIVAAAQYSEQFISGHAYRAGETQYDNWISFRASLPTSGVNSITVRGSRDTTGRSCTDPVKAQQIADAMRAGTSKPGISLSLSCDGFKWNTSSCSNTPFNEADLSLTVGPGSHPCDCSKSNYIIRPGIAGEYLPLSSSNWGGIAGPTCSAPSQFMEVVVNTGMSIGIDIKPWSDPNSINLCSKGAVQVALLGDTSFDVSLVDKDSLRFADSAVKMVGKKDPNTLCSIEDVNLDGFNDLVCHFVTTDIAALDGESVSAEVNGALLDGTSIKGADSVNIVKYTCK